MEPITNIAWAAGIFEGEGSISASRWWGTRAGGERVRSSRYSVNMALKMKDRDILERFQAVVGCGNLTGPNAAGLYNWQAAATCDVVRVLWLLKDYLGPRRRAQVKRALRLRGISRRQHPSRQKIRGC